MAAPITRLINAGSGLEIISTKENLRELVGIQVISDSALNAPIILNLRQSNDAAFTEGGHDLPEVPITTDAGANSNLLASGSFNCDFIAVNIDVLTATLGELTILTNYKD